MWLGSAILLLALAFTPHAQTLDGAALSGVVIDPTGAAVSGVAVRLVHIDTGGERLVRTDLTGRFKAVSLRVGRYRLRVEDAPLGSAWHEVRLRVGDEISLNLHARVTAPPEAVEVRADPAAAPVSTVTSGATMTSLPSRTRDFREFAALAPAVHQILGTRGTLRVAGQPGDYLGLVVDGADFTNGFFGEFIGSLETKNFTIPFEGVEEFRVAAAGSNAEHGRSTGGVVQVVTKSGTNTRQGTASYFLRHHRLSAADAFGNVPAGLVRHQFGGGIGGPIARNRTFYFAASELRSQRTPLTIEFARDVRGVGVPELGIQDLSRLEGQLPRDEVVFATLGRIDHSWGARHRFTSRLNVTHHQGQNMAGGSLIVARAASNLESFSNTAASLLVGSSTIRQRLALETRVQLSFENRPRRPQGPGPQVQIADTGRFGASSVLPVSQDMWRYQAAQHATYVVGGHTLQAGADYNGFAVQNSSFAVARHGVYTFPTLERFVQRQPSSYGQFFGLDGRDAGDVARIDSLRQHELALYIQDEFRPAVPLTLRIGLRYDAQFNPDPAFGTAGVRVPVGEPRRFGDTVVLQYAPVPQGIPDDTNNVAPRMALSYDVSGTGATVARVTAGYHFGRTPMIYFPVRGSGVVSSTIFGPPTRFGVVFPEVLPGTLESGTKLEHLIPRPSIHYVDPDFQNPRVLHVTSSLSQRLGRQWTAGATYIFSDMRNLRIGGFRSTVWDRNLPPPVHFDEFGRGILPPSDRPDTTIGEANALASFGRGRYRALLLRLAGSAADTVRFDATYTLASSKGNGSTERDTEAAFGPSDPFDLEADYGANELDVRHAFTSQLVARLPLDLTLGSIWMANSGVAFPAYAAADINGDRVQNNGMNPDRPVVDGQLLPRFPFHQPPVFTWDLRLARTFSFSGGTWQAIVDVFNVLNAGNLFSDPRTNAVVGSPNFRELNRTHGSRMAQVGLRIEF